MDQNNGIQKKIEEIITFLKGKKVIVAFSGGVDSSLLAFLSKQHAKDTLLVTERSVLYPEEEIEVAGQFANRFQIPHIILERNPLKDENFKRNPENRCYICKKGLYNDIIEVKNSRNFDIIVDGSNWDDLADHRPGMQAVRELGIYMPYIDFKIKKSDIREICRYFNLEVESKPSMACFSSRIPYDQIIDETKLKLIREGEAYLKKTFNLKQLRVRYHENRLARIEFLPEDLPRIMTMANLQKIKHKFKELGFCYITIDVEGFRSGSLNEILRLVE